MRAALAIPLLAMALVLPLASYADEPDAAAPPTDLGAPASSATLAEQRGGDETNVINTIHINGDVTNNTAQDVVTGANSIQDGSFANSSGIMSVVQNTGANVLIQSATIVNVQFAPP
jgi:hypothetical protein